MPSLSRVSFVRALLRPVAARSGKLKARVATCPPSRQPLTGDRTLFSV